MLPATCFSIAEPDLVSPSPRPDVFLEMERAANGAIPVEATLVERRASQREPEPPNESAFGRIMMREDAAHTKPRLLAAILSVSIQRQCRQHVTVACFDKPTVGHRCLRTFNEVLLGGGAAVGDLALRTLNVRSRLARCDGNIGRC